MIIARSPLITMHKPCRDEQGCHLVCPKFVWTDKEKISAIKSNT